MAVTGDGSEMQFIISSVNDISHFSKSFSNSDYIAYIFLETYGISVDEKQVSK